MYPELNFFLASPHNGRDNSTVLQQGKSDKRGGWEEKASHPNQS